MPSKGRQSLPLIENIKRHTPSKDKCRIRGKETRKNTTINQSSVSMVRAYIYRLVLFRKRDRREGPKRSCNLIIARGVRWRSVDRAKTVFVHKLAGFVRKLGVCHVREGSAPIVRSRARGRRVRERKLYAWLVDRTEGKAPILYDSYLNFLVFETRGPNKQVPFGHLGCVRI